MREFIRTRGVMVCQARTAGGTGWHKPTAAGCTKEASRWLNSHKPTAECNEENLAKAKILTMLQDLGGRVIGHEGELRKKPQSRQIYIDRAYRFFFSLSQKRELEAWCDTAGFDPEYVRDRARNVYENGLPQHRAAPGEGKRYQERREYRQRIGAQRIDA